jgi:hypothetical protein
MRIRAFVLTLALTPLPLAASTSLLVPAYFDPSSGNGWNTLISSVSSAVPITAIMNPNNGPVAKVDPAYTSDISAFEAAGGVVVGYVHTSYGARALSTVEGDISTYESEYPGIKGIFVDEMDNTSSNLSYYRKLYSYIKTVNSSWQVVGNPGQNTLASYLSPTPTANELVTFENGSGYTSYTPASWEGSYNTSNFANIVYAVPDAATMESYLSLAPANHAANVYFTDASGTNPYAGLPSYWTTEVAAIRAINSPPLVSSYNHSGSGDYNSSANWTAAVPNGINAEAEFLNAITANHTVYSDVPITLGTLIFNNTKSYVLAGAGSLTLQSTSGSASIQAQAGIQKITLPITIASNTMFNASAGATLVIAAPVTINAGATLSESGAGTINILAPLTLAGGASTSLQAGSSVQSLVIGTASTATLLASVGSNPSALQLESLSIAPGAILNLNGQDLIIHNGNLPVVSSLIASGGISGQGSSSPATAHLRAIGAILNSNGSSVIDSSFDGESASSTDLLLKSTLYGDANLSGTVDASDFARIDSGFVSVSCGWFNGDFNYDGVINGADFTLIDDAFNLPRTVSNATVTAEIASQIGSVPEPMDLIWVTAALVAATRLGRGSSLRPTRAAEVSE